MSQKNRNKRPKSEVQSSPEISKESIEELRRSLFQEIHNKTISTVEQLQQNHSQKIAQSLPQICKPIFGTLEKHVLHLLERIEKLESVQSQIEQLQSEKQQMATKIQHLEDKVNRLEQENLSKCLEISGADSMLQDPSKPLRNIVSELFTANSIPHDVNSIAHVQIRETASESKPRKFLTVTFNSYADKMQVMKRKFANDKGKKKVKIFFGHSLTKNNRLLYNQARAAVKSDPKKQVYIARGRIYVKNASGKFGTLINSFDDIERISLSPEKHNFPQNSHNFNS